MNYSEKDYRDAVTAGDDCTGFYHFIGASLAIIITTANKRVNQQMRETFNASGFCYGAS